MACLFLSQIPHEEEEEADTDLFCRGMMTEERDNWPARARSNACARVCVAA